jgi:GNAT superfamily N-acetyltransferase
MRIRIANVDDVGAIAAVHCAAALSAYAHIFPRDAEAPTPESLAPEYAALVADPHATVYVAEDADIIGCIALHAEADVPSGWLLSRLYVTPSKWRFGIGAELHDRVLDTARACELATLHLWTLEANGRARAMYERRGWQLVPGRRLVNGDFDPPIEDVLYERNLTPPERTLSGSPGI